MVYIDIIGSISLFILIAFLMWKAVCQWNKPGPFWQFWQWEKRRLMYIRDWKTWIKERPYDWLEWWQYLSDLKKFYFVLAGAVSYIFLYSLSSIFPKFIGEIAEMRASLGDLSLAVFACLSGIGAVFGFYTSILRTETQEQGLVTDRINKAVEGLGKTNLKDEPVIEVRIGALYALERIAKDSIRDHVQILEILLAYIHHNSPFSSKLKNPRKDMQVVATIIGRRKKWSNGSNRIRKELQIYEYYRIDLQKCDLRNTDFAHGYMRSVRFNGSNMNSANFNSANVFGADFENTDLRDANFRNANLERAGFSGANLQSANLVNTKLYKAQFANGTWIKTDFTYANMSEAYIGKVNSDSACFRHVNFSNVTISHATIINADFSDAKITNASIHHSDLSGVNLSGTNLSNTHISQTNLSGANLTLANLKDASLGLITIKHAFAESGDFSDCKTLTQDHIDEMFCGVNLKISSNLTRPKHWPKKELPFFNAYYEWKAAQE